MVGMVWLHTADVPGFRRGQLHPFIEFGQRHLDADLQ
jgi:hypothetical protein